MRRSRTPRVPTLALTPRVALAPTPGDQLYPAVASNGSEFLVAWEDRRDGSIDETDIYASRVAADGTTLDPDGIPIATAAGLQWTPEVASDGTNFLVVWTDSSAGNRGDVLAARVTPQGEVLDPGGFVLTAPEQYGGYRPHAAFDGENYLVTYENCYCIRGVRVTPDGTILPPGGVHDLEHVRQPEKRRLLRWRSSTSSPGTATPASSARVSGPTAGFSIRTGSRSRRTTRTDTRSRCRHSTARTSSSRGKTDATTGTRTASTRRASRPKEPSSIQGASRSLRRRRTWPATRVSPPVAKAPSSPPGSST